MMVALREISWLSVDSNTWAYIPPNSQQDHEYRLVLQIHCNYTELN